jgi:hypothetical protein
MDFIESRVLLTVQYSDGCYLETLDFQPKQTEENLDWLVHLDRKVYLTGTYEDGHTTFTLEYGTDLEGLMFVDASTGNKLNVVSSDETTVTVMGNHPAVIAGVVYEMRYEFSPVYMKDKDNVPLLGSILTLKTWEVQFEDTIDFSIEVTPFKRKTYTNKYTTKQTGIAALVGDWETKSDSMRVPVLGDSTTTRIELTSSSYFPCFFMSATWEGDYVMRTRRV